MRESGIKTGEWVHHAEAVRANQAHLAPDRFLDLALVLHSLFTYFLESGGDDDSRRNSEAYGIPDQLRDAIRGRGDHDAIGPLGKVMKILVGVNTEDVIALGVDRVNGAAER